MGADQCDTVPDEAAYGLRLQILLHQIASGMEKQLDEIEGKIQILMNEPVPMSEENKPQLDDFADDSEVSGTRR